MNSARAVLLITFCWLVFRLSWSEARGEYLDPTTRINVNEQTDLFEKSIEGWQDLQGKIKNDKAGTISGIEAGRGIEDLGIDRNVMREEANKLSNIKPTDLNGKGQEELMRQNVLDELYIDYSRPLYKQHLEDAKNIANAQDGLMGNLLDKLREIGVDCRTVKGPKEIEPAYYLQVKNTVHKNTIYNQTLCEELRNTYHCNDSVSLKCVKRGKRFGEWQYRVIKLNGGLLKRNKEDWGYAKKRYRKYWDWFITPYHPKSFGGGIFSDPDLTVDSPWCNNPQAIINDARLYLADLLNIALEQIREDIVFPPSGVGIGPQYNGYGRWVQVWNEYEFGYYYRDASDICEQWAEDWTENCRLR